MRSGKSSAVADIAAQLGTEGRAGPHTPASAAQDLFALEEELAQFDHGAIAPPRRGPGRPKGVVDRTTLQLSRFLRMQGYRDPAEFLASIVSMDTLELQTKLGGEVAALDVLKVQQQAARELMPYFHQKMPLAIQHVDAPHRPLIVINDGPDGIGSKLAHAYAQMSVHEDVEYQEVSEDDAASSHEEASHE